MWKLTRKILLLTLAFLLICIAFLVVINGFKKEPSPTNRLLAQTPVNPYADSENLFLARHAINLPEMEDRHTQAKNRVLLQMQWDEAYIQGRLTREQLEAHKSAHPHIVFANSIEWCNPAVRPCLEEIDQQHAAIVASKTNNALLLKRYLELSKFPGSHDITPANPAAPMATDISKIRLLFLASVGDAFLKGSANERADAVEQLSGDLSVWKKTLASYGSLIDKMIAAHYLHQSLALIGEIVNHPRFNAERDGLSLAAVLNDTAIPDVSGMWRYEYLFVHLTLEAMDAQSAGESLRSPDENWDAVPSAIKSLMNAASLWFMDRTDTQNRSADYFSQMIAATQLPAPQALVALQSLETSNGKEATPWWSYLHNPVGKTMFPSQTPYPEYIRRIYDVFAYQQLVLLSYQWRIQKRPSADIPIELTNNLLARHPASATPFQYDAQNHTLRMEPLHQRQDRRFIVKLFSPSSP